ncbi:MAG: MFS transporter [Alphaproteobacteria bacterium]
MINRHSFLVLFGAAVVLTLCMGMRQSFGLFQAPMLADLPITAAGFGLAIAVQNLVWGLVQPPLGMLADRYGSRRVVIGGTLVYAAGLFAMMHAGGSWSLLFGAGLLVGTGVGATAFGILMGAVAAHVPPARRSEALGIVAAFGSFGTIVIAPLSQTLIEAFDWRMAIGAMCLIALAMLPFAWMLGPKPELPAGSETLRQSTREALGEALSHRGYLLLTLGFFACGFQLVFIVTHLPAFLATCGVSPMVAAQSLGLIGLCNVVGTYAMGWLGGRYSKKNLLAGVYFVRTIAIIAYLAIPITATSTLVFAATIGFFWLGTAPLTSAIVVQMFGLRHMSTLYGVVFLSHQVGSFLGAWAGGLVFALTGAYDLLWAAVIAVGFTAALLNVLMDDRPIARPLPA